MKKTIPIFKLKFDKNFVNKYILNCKKIFASDSISEGNFTRKFERKFKIFQKTKYAIAANSGTAALEIAFKSINVNFVSYEESEYILMTNKVAYDNESISNLSKAKTCYDKFEGINISTVSRRGLVLSTIRKKL